MAEGDETCARIEGEEPRGTFHFLNLEGLIKTKSYQRENFHVTPVLLSDERRSPPLLSLAVMAAIASRLQTLLPRKQAANSRARHRYGTMSISCQGSQDHCSPPKSIL
jgi:hypothetical protein